MLIWEGRDPPRNVVGLPFLWMPEHKDVPALPGVVAVPLLVFVVLVLVTLWR